MINAMLNVTPAMDSHSCSYTYERKSEILLPLQLFLNSF